MLTATQNPYRMAEMALELQIEKLRVAEITNARDAALHRLSDAYTHIREKNELLEHFQVDREGGVSDAEIASLKAHILALESTTIRDLRLEVEGLRSKLAERAIEPPPSYTENSVTKVTWLLRDFCVGRLNSFIQPAQVDVSTETEPPTKVDADVATNTDETVNPTSGTFIRDIDLVSSTPHQQQTTLASWSPLATPCSPRSHFPWIHLTTHLARS